MATVLVKQEAMATLFEFRIDHDDEAYAKQAAADAFAEVRRLEEILSRFIEGSDVWRINHTETLERLWLSEECHGCLLKGLDMMAATGGAFDMMAGAAAEKVRNVEGALVDAQVLRELLAMREGAVFRIDPESPQVEVAGINGALDLGALGKGFALDWVRALLVDWEVERGLLGGSSSSLLAFTTGEPWQVQLSGERTSVSVLLGNAAMGSSGTGVKGKHIINTRTGEQSYTHVRAWAIAPCAAEADALSTAWMLLSQNEIGEVLSGLGAGYAAAIEQEDGLIFINDGGGGWQLPTEREGGWQWG